MPVKLAAMRGIYWLLIMPADNGIKKSVCRVLTSANVCDQIVHALVGKQFGKQARPVRLNLHVGSCGQLLNVVNLRKTAL